MSLHDALLRSGALRTLDHALAQTLRRLDPATPDRVLAAAALASLAVAHGHAGFDPARPQLLVDALLDWPEAADWAAEIAGSRWVVIPSALDAPARPDAPLVYEGGLLYLRRYREYERRLAAGLRRIAAGAPGTAELAPLQPLFHALFPRAGEAEDRQARAVALAMLHPLLLVTGGPGTGKTTTIARLLLMRVAQARSAGDPPPRIALAAPTGRAAERMAESLRKAVAILQANKALDPDLYSALPATASTLHRLLGTIPDQPDFRHHADNPLPFEVIVVDEASMIDLPLICKLVEAVADGASLVLLGDPDQLPSVEAGDVLAAILAAAGPGDALDAADAERLQPLLGPPLLLQAQAATHGLAGQRVHLSQGYRQAERFELAPLALAVREGDADQALALLRGGLSGVHFHPDLPDPLESHRDLLLGHWRALAEAPDPASALAQAGRFRLLTALREGPQGARRLNARIEEALGGHGGGAGYFHGRLLLVTENSYRHQLFNGDVGICLRDARGALMAWFPGEQAGEVRQFHPAALPAHESAFAITVHKAQGSEFDEVWLQLPRHDSRVLSRELVYTALTRARRRLHLAAGETVLRSALGRHAARISGLAARLCAPQTMEKAGIRVRDGGLE